MRSSYLRVLGLLAGLLMLSCASIPESHLPPWATQPSRTVDNGYIVYIGTGVDPSPERAQFLAEGAALQDLANECSFAPKGTRIEDKFSEKIKYQYHAYAKVGVEIQDCDVAKKSLDPKEIRDLANQPFTDQVKKYQDLVDEEEPTAVADGTPINPPAQVNQASSPSVVVVHDNMSFFVARQYVAYQKEVVILSPATTYAPATPETMAFRNNVSTATTQVAQYEHDNPQIRAAPTTWSSLPNRPAAHTLKPANLKAMTPRAARPQAIRPPNKGNDRQGGRPGENGGSGKPRGKKRRRNWGE